MAQFVKLNPSELKALRTIDKRLISYNVEMTEVTGGTFWKAYTPEQILGIEEVPPVDVRSGGMHQWYDPIDTTNPRLINLTKKLGPVWIRVSGTWATKTYYDFDGTTGGKAPAGYDSVLTKQQWLNLLDFAKAVDGKVLISVANCEGLHSAEEPWNPSEAEKIFSLSKAYGVPISAAEFTNEPNVMSYTGFPAGYTPAHFRRDQDLFNSWVRENYPECLVVGPCTTDSSVLRMGPKSCGGVADVLGGVGTDELLEGCQVKMDVFSYHYYNGISERMAAMLPDAHWQHSEATSEAYLSVAGGCARGFAKFRDKYMPCAPMWVTESGDAGAGGNTWASTYTDVLRTLNEFGEFSCITDGVIFHNTLASSDYGYLKHGTFEPRPSYFAVLLWKALMGETVYDSGEPIREGAHVYAHSRRDGKEGVAYLIINNSLTDPTTVELPKEAEVYSLNGKDGIRSLTMCLNGRELVLGENDELPELTGMKISGKVEVAPGSCTFIVI
ncbi:MAG: beta-glucuronidase [Oscillospiraceae bacterium]|nr:beta-glucuronidase [Oscillospiraceae bacterium]